MKKKPQPPPPIPRAHGYSHDAKLCPCARCQQQRDMPTEQPPTFYPAWGSVAE